MKLIVLSLISAIAIAQAGVVPNSANVEDVQPIVLLNPELPITNPVDVPEDEPEVGKFERIIPLLAPTLENLGQKLRSLDQDVVADIKRKVLESLSNIQQAAEDVAVVVEPEVSEGEGVKVVDTNAEHVSIVKEAEIPEFNEGVQVVDNSDDVIIVKEPEVQEFNKEDFGMEQIGKDLNIIDFDPNSIVHVVDEIPALNENVNTADLPIVHEDFVHVVNSENGIPFVRDIIIVGMPTQIVEQVHRFVEQVQVADQPEQYQTHPSGKVYDNPYLR